MNEDRRDWFRYTRTSACEPDEYTETESFGEALGNKRPTNSRGTRINRLIDQGWGPPEIGQIAEGDVPWIRTCRVQFWNGGRVFRFQKSMAEVTVGKSVGTDLEPDDDSMDFGDGADERMMNEFVHRQARDEK